MEVWQDIKDHVGFQVSNTGKVRSLDKYVGAKNGSFRFLRGRVLHQRVNTSGYFDTALMKKRVYVHTLVAEAFVEKKDGCYQVNHIDEDKLNNIPSNLEWCNQRQNNRHGTRLRRLAMAVGYKITSVDCITGKISEYGSIKDAARSINVPYQSLKYALMKSKTCFGHRWEIQNTKQTRDVGIVDQSGNVVKKYPSMKAAGDDLGIKTNAIWRTCQGMTKTAGGIRLKYL